MEKQDRIDQLHEAQSMILEAVILIKEAVQDTSVEARAHSYLISDLEIAATEEHDWLAENFGNIDALIRTLDEETDADDEGDDDPTCPPSAPSPWPPDEDEDDWTEDEGGELPIVPPSNDEDTDEVILPAVAHSDNPGDDPRLPPPVGGWLRSLHRGVQYPMRDDDYDYPYFIQ